jgi:hypothetical protein
MANTLIKTAPTCSMPWADTSAMPNGERAGVRPLGVDRLGVRLRIENDEQTDARFRLPFQRPATTPVQLASRCTSRPDAP